MTQAFILIAITFVITFPNVKCDCPVSCNRKSNGIAQFTRNVFGEIFFTYKLDEASYIISGEVQGFGNNSVHGVHIHQFGDTGNECLAAGPHYNPKRQKHGGRSTRVRHAGDLGNFVADADGVMRFNVSIKGRLLGPCNAILGRSVVIHQDRDDLGRGGDAGSMTTGNSVIGITP